MTPDTLQSPPAGPSRQASVRALRSRLEAAPEGRLVMPRDEVLGLLAPPDGDGGEQADGDARREGSRYAQSLLAQHGIRATPPLTETAGEVTLTTSRSYAIQGALAVTLVALVVGLVGYWVYGLLFLAAGLLATAGIAFAFDALRRELPGAVPRGRLLGAALAGGAVVIVFIAAVLPIRAHRKDVGRARGLVVQADAAIDAGDLQGARNKLFAAEGIVDHPPLIDDVRAHLTTASIQKALDDQALKQAVYNRAERAFERGDAAGAIRLGRKIRGFADINQRLREYARAERRGARGG